VNPAKGPLCQLVNDFSRIASGPLRIASDVVRLSVMSRVKRDAVEPGYRLLANVEQAWPFRSGPSQRPHIFAGNRLGRDVIEH